MVKVEQPKKGDNMKKKSILLSILALCMLIPASLMLVACKDNDHNFSDKWESDASEHWHVCLDDGCNEVSNKAKHESGDWIIDTVATCENEGSRHKECTVCHRVTAQEDITKTECNYVDHVCTMCGGLENGYTITVTKLNVTKAYATLQEAIDDAETGSTITLTENIDVADLKDTTKNHFVIAEKTLTFDLNGKTVKGDGCDGVFDVKGAANVTIKGNGYVVAKECSCGYAMAVWAHENAQVTIENGSFSQTMITPEEDLKGQYDMIYARGNGKITILGGRYESVRPRWTLNVHNGSTNASIEVKGGTFIGYNPGVSDTEDQGAGVNINYVAEGYTVEKENDSDQYTVVSDTTVSE